MRIIAGIAGGIRLKSTSGQAAIRPTSDRVKEALFAALGDIQGWQVADLFAGSGALGLEALSRGAAFVALVERDRQCVRCIRGNLERVSQAFEPEVEADVRIIQTDVANAVECLREFDGALDLILADPPYNPAADDFGAAQLLDDDEFAHWGRNALMVLEHGSATALPWAPLSPWRLIRQRKFGSRTLSFCRVT